MHLLQWDVAALSIHSFFHTSRNKESDMNEYCMYEQSCQDSFEYINACQIDANILSKKTLRTFVEGKRQITFN